MVRCGVLQGTFGGVPVGSEMVLGVLEGVSGFHWWVLSVLDRVQGVLEGVPGKHQWFLLVLEGCLCVF